MYGAESTTGIRFSRVSGVLGSIGEEGRCTEHDGDHVEEEVVVELVRSPVGERSWSSWHCGELVIMVVLLAVLLQIAPKSKTPEKLEKNWSTHAYEEKVCGSGKPTWIYITIRSM